jgi:predicted O-methyltransferase YrrM
MDESTHPAFDRRQSDVERVRQVIERVVREGTMVARSTGAVHALFPVAISPPEGAGLREWVVREGAKNTIEIGLGYAVSALFICEGLLINGGGRHLVVDPFQMTRFAGCGLQLLDDAGVAGFVEHNSDESQIALPRLLTAGRRFDLAFVDGNHRFDGVFLDLIYLGRLLHPGSVVFLDDYQLRAVERAAAFCLRNLAWTLLEVSAADSLHQWAVLRTAETPDTPPFDYFVDF